MSSLSTIEYGELVNKTRDINEKEETTKINSDKNSTDSTEKNTD